MAGIKTLSFAVVHFSVAFSVAYVITGNLALGGLLALVEPLVNTAAFYLHEHAWLRWGPERRDARASLHARPTLA